MKPDTQQEFDPELLENLVDDNELSQLSLGALKPQSIKASRSRGDWPYDTFHIGRKPFSDKRQFIQGLIAGRSRGKGVAV